MAARLSEGGIGESAQGKGPGDACFEGSPCDHGTGGRTRVQVRATSAPEGSGVSTSATSPGRPGSMARHSAISQYFQSHVII